MREQASEFSGVLAHAVGPGHGLSADATAGPEPPLSFAGNKAHELLGKSDVVEGHGSHAAAGADSGNLVTAELGWASPPRDPEVSAAGLVVGRWRAATTAASGLEGPASGGSRSSGSAVAPEEVSSGNSELAVDGDRGQAEDSGETEDVGLHVDGTEIAKRESFKSFSKTKGLAYSGL